MIDIASTTIPFFALVLCGWLAARTRRLPEQAVGSLNGYVLWFALPAMLFRFVAQTPVAAILDWRIALGYAGCGLTVYASAAIGLHLSRASAARHQADRVDTAFGALAAAWPNWGYMGFGLLPALFGTPAIAIMVSAGIMDLLVLMPMASLLAARRRSDGARSGLVAGLISTARNPLLVAIAAGLTVSLLQLRIAAPIDEFLRLLGSSAGPVALFAIGVFVYRPGPVHTDQSAWMLVVLKLVVHPALMWLIATHLLRLPSTTVAVLTVVAALPAAGTAFLFVERNGGNVERIAAAILISTSLSFVSVTGVTSWLRWLAQ